MDTVNISQTDENADWIKTLRNVLEELEIHAVLEEEYQQKTGPEIEAQD